MAVTAHYTTYDDSGHLSLRTELIGFRYTPEGHSGKELAPIFFEILNKAGILHKVLYSIIHDQQPTLTNITGSSDL